MSYGFIYVMTNHYMPGLVKIGMTTRSPTQRLNELSGSTGVPYEFTLDFYAEVPQPADLERRLHEHFASRRVCDRREFFQIGVMEAVDAIYDTEEPVTSYHGDTVISALETRHHAYLIETGRIQMVAA